ncbi:hypothetical protein [Chromobacterium haemolyticum]|uniref:hypothetical protein n=1 Tax=Chromobacterium haemolyticum TaxID=394935 RepID=UPI0009EF838A|nr:hypothetical protein [Chromobacterium haemolyticum]OQS40628.1 hypothetical protein B0T39_11435 [Chromobacterium haemolyticum]
MRVASMALSMSSQYSFSQSLSVQQQSRTWAQLPPSSPPAKPSSDVSLSSDGVNASAKDKAFADGMTPMLGLIKDILEKVLGVKFKVVDGTLQRDDGQDEPSADSRPARSGQSSVPQSQQARAGGELKQTVDYQESESLAFSAKGSIKTQDGREFNFALDVQMSRSFEYHSSSTIQFGNGKATDPLMLSLGNDAGSFSGASVSFDLQSNGKQTQLPFINNGGWLALDRNGDGKINDGKELFGTQSGNGFADLAKLDGNGDGVLDDGDAAFAQLKLWSGRDGDKDQLMGLKELGIGAILLPSVDSPFSIKNADNQSQADIRRSGVYLTEDGRAGRVSQVDVYG